jgi:UDP-glucose 4-epimerase
MKKKNILITGGAGFIGFNLYLKLFKKNNIYILDLKKKIDQKPFKKNCKFIYGDISDKNIFNDLIKKKIIFEYIYHLAAETSTYISEIKKNKCYKTNVMGALNLCNFCEKIKPKNLIFSSSMAVYGKNSYNKNEEFNCKPISHYGISKLSSENIFLKLKNIGINVKIFRIFNAYGIFQDYNNPYQGMLSIYLSQIKRNSEVQVTGSLNRSRDFIYIEDILNAFTNLKILKNKEIDIFNLGSGKEIIVYKLIKKIFKLTSKNYKVIVGSHHSGDTDKSCANIYRIKKFGWKPKITLNRGIKKVINDINYFDENNSSFNR